MIAQKIKFINGIIIFLDLVFIMLTGLILNFALSLDPQETFLYIYRSEWVTVHYWASIVLCILVLIYILMEWKWIVTMFKFHAHSPKDL